eukprot:1108560-Prymnesium_polylepis.1
MLRGPPNMGSKQKVRVFGPPAARPHRALGAWGGCAREEHKINNEGKRQPLAPRVADIRTRTWAHAV